MKQTNVNVVGRRHSLIVSQARLKELLDYDKDTGVFTWKIKVSGNTKVGDQAGSVDAKGYRWICIGGERYSAQSLAWYYVYGEYILVDHKNNKPWENWINNLREANYSQNNHRKKVYNSLGYTGVRFRSGKYQAHIRINGVITRIGAYDTVEEAAEAYKQAAKEHYGEFANG